jgi:hypothetical protein
MIIYEHKHRRTHHWDAAYKLETRHWSTIDLSKCSIIVQMVFLILSYPYEVILVDLAKYCLFFFTCTMEGRVPA